MDVNDVISDEETEIQLNLNVNVDGVTQTKSIRIPLNSANPKKDNKGKYNINNFLFLWNLNSINICVSLEEVFNYILIYFSFW